MDISAYCKKLQHLRDTGLSPGSYFGARWIILKILVIGMGVGFLLHQDAGLRTFGGVVLGYGLGVTFADVRSWLLSRNAWKHQERVVNWDLVEELAGERESG